MVGLSHMHVTISPEFLSHAGVMEAAGIMLNRNEENPTRISNEIVKQAQQEAVDEIQMITLFEAKGGHYERV